jgi:hypothetical protein
MFTSKFVSFLIGFWGDYSFRLLYLAFTQGEGGYYIQHQCLGITLIGNIHNNVISIQLVHAKIIL